jgi:hypothetical protein
MSLRKPHYSGPPLSMSRSLGFQLSTVNEEKKVNMVPQDILREREREKCSLHRVHYCLWLQASTEGPEACPPWIRELVCTVRTLSVTRFWTKQTQVDFPEKMADLCV